MPKRLLKICVEKKKRFAVTAYINQGGEEMIGKKPSEEMDKEDFFRRFDFVNGYDAMIDFTDK